MQYIVEWHDREGDRHELTFDNRADADAEAARLEEEFPFVAVVLEIEV